MLVSNIKDWYGNVVLEEKNVWKKKLFFYFVIYNEILCYIFNRIVFLIIKYILNYLKERNGNNLLVL